MGRKPKLINNLNRVISENEIQLIDDDFLIDENIVFKEIESHILNSTFKNAEWRLMVFGYFDFNEVKNFESKSCFYRINLDLFHLKAKDLFQVKDKFNIIEDEGFKPIPLVFNGAIILYSN